MRFKAYIKQTSAMVPLSRGGAQVRAVAGVCFCAKKSHISNLTSQISQC